MLNLKMRFASLFSVKGTIKYVASFLGFFFYPKLNVSDTLVTFFLYFFGHPRRVTEDYIINIQRKSYSGASYFV